MRKKLPVLDTNVIIRFLTNDTPEQAKRVETLLNQATVKSLFIPDIIIAEIIYVLLSFYKLPKKEVVEKVSVLLDFEKIRSNKKLLKKTLEIFEENNLSFADAYLTSLVLLSKNSFIYSFDKRLSKIEGVVVQTP